MSLEAIQDLARRFARERVLPEAARWDREARFPWPLFQEAAAIGFPVLVAPEALGGAGLGPEALAVVAEELAYACPGIAAALLLNNLVADALLLSESPYARAFVPRLRREVASYALTEPQAGSDVAALRTRAERVPGGYRLFGRKTWISHAPEAGFFLVFARVGEGREGIAAFLLERGEGVEVGPPLPKMGQKASPAAEVALEGAFVPEEGLVAREGFRLAMRVFNRSRPMVAALAVGLLARALEEALAYASLREAFGKPLLEHQGVGFKLAEMAIDLEAARLLTQKAARLAEEGENALEAAMAKAFAADAAVRGVSEALQVFGGNGYSEDYPMAKLYRDAKVLQIYEGTSEIQRLIVLRELVRRRG
ncbi:acyl-CoA dehydrogenase family protein [Thermus igniterrae]|uniref:acyl-CoA dehydrogenase family protein n=1 Tax=Thermus igniterrae TaxID=88189 RepID=UPI000363D649|nr:acyl-CoA dehydrogenase family protein [Thermus igniterrae]